MSAVSNIPRELQDSIRDALDRRVKLSIKRMVRQETRSDKVENKILAFSACRLFILTAKVPCKVDSSIHYLDMHTLESKKQNQLSITVGEKTHIFSSLESDTEGVNYMITHVGTSVKQIFPAFPLERILKNISVSPPERLKVMHDMMREIEKKDPGPCGGFSHMYACMCDYHLLPYREEVSWDVDTIYLSQDSKELCLKDFDHLDGRDLVPVISALEHNPWFTKLNANNVKLVPEALTEVLKVIKKNSVIEELHMSNTGLKAEFVQKLSIAVLSNIGSQLSKIDLSHNIIEDRGILHMTGVLAKLSKGLEYLNLGKTAITGKGIGKVAEALISNKVMPTSLQTLILADSSVKGEDSATPTLFNFLAQPNAISHLDLSNTEVSLDGLCAALLRGCLQNLGHLNLANNMFTQKKTKEVFIPPSWKKFFSSACSLQSLNLSGNKLAPEVIKELLLGVSSNVHIHNLHLDLSSNDLRSLGSRVIESCIPPNTSITSLDISDNGFEQEMTSLLPWIQQNRTLKKLAIGRNFTGVKAKHLGQVLEAVVLMIQDEDSTIESLSLADSKLRNDTAMVINALGSNTSLTEIDISGNAMGDFGARMLAKALQINTKLRSVIWDRNHTSVQGFEDVASAMEKNYTLRKMPIPVNDAAGALKMHTEKTESALQKIEVLLQRNHSSRKFASDQAYRLQQGFLISSTQQMVDRLVVQVQDTMNALTMGPSDRIQDDLDKAGHFISDADKSRQLLPRLQEIAIKSQDVGNPVQTKLTAMAQELRTVLERHLQQTVDEMLKCVDKQCVAVMEDTTFQADLKEECKKKSSLPRDFTKFLLDGVETDVINKLSESNLMVAAHVSDRVMDEVIENLAKTHKTLTNHLNVQKSALKRESSRTTKDQKEQENEMTITEEDKVGGKSTDSPRLSNKRKSLAQIRKQRPQSVIDRKLVGAPVIEDTAASDESNSMTASPIGDAIEENALDGRPAERLELGSLDTLPDLCSVQKLQHINKDRPRRAKKTAVTRPMAKPTNLVDDESLQTSMTNSFYESKPVDDFMASPARQFAKTDINENEKTSVSSARHEKKKWFSTSKDKDKDKEKKEKDKGASNKTGFASGFSNLFSKVKPHSNKAGSAEKKPLEEQKTVVGQSGKPEKKYSFHESSKASIPETKEDKIDSGTSGNENQPNGSAATLSSPATTTTTASSEEADKSSPPPYSGPKLPSKQAKQGLGGGLLAEMKTQKQFTVRHNKPSETKSETRQENTGELEEKNLPELSKPAVSSPEPDKPKVIADSPKATMESPKQSMDLPTTPKVASDPPKQKKSVEESPKAKVEEPVPEKTEAPEIPVQKVALVPPNKRPTPKPRASKPLSVGKEEEESTPVAMKRMSKPAPPPISSKPRPSVAPRSPVNSMRNSDTDVKLKEKTVPKVETSPSASSGGISGVVYDSSTLRLSVKGKIRKLGLEKKIEEAKEASHTSGETTRDQRASSEPRDTPPPLSEPADSRPNSMFVGSKSPGVSGISLNHQENVSVDGSATNGVKDSTSNGQSDEPDSAGTGTPPSEELNKEGETKTEDSSIVGHKRGSAKRASLAEEENVIYI